MSPIWLYVPSLRILVQYSTTLMHECFGIHECYTVWEVSVCVSLGRLECVFGKIRVCIS
jgi:hypothetical protein